MLGLSVSGDRRQNIPLRRSQAGLANQNSAASRSSATTSSPSSTGSVVPFIDASIAVRVSAAALAFLSQLDGGSPGGASQGSDGSGVGGPPPGSPPGPPPSQTSSSDGARATDFPGASDATTHSTAGDSLPDLLQVLDAYAANSSSTATPGSGASA